MKRVGRTIRALRDPRRSDGVLDTLPLHLWEDRTFIPRLAWKGGDPVPLVVDDLVETIRGAGDAAFFLDNAFFDDRIDDSVWEALLAEPGRLVITPRVWDELKEWLGRRKQHPVSKAIAAKNPAVVTHTEPGASGKAAFDYYLALLWLRRRPLDRFREAFRSEHGREAAPHEDAALVAKVQQYFGARGYMLAKKPAAEGTDEALVYLAVEHALTTGRQSVILSPDADVQEQFYKLLWLIDTHYRSMLLGDRYAELTIALRPRPFPTRIAEDPRFPFERDGAVLIDRDASVDLHELLPSEFHFVAISCWTVGPSSFSTLVFGAEQEMTRLLEVKNKTGGLSTDRLGDRNVHAWLAPLPLHPRDALCGAVARDRRKRIRDSDASFAILDFLQAMGDFETHGEFGPQGDPFGIVRPGPTDLSR